MLKKTAIIIAAFSLSGMLLADNTGCGLGTMLFKGKSGPIWELSAVTTNDFNAGTVVGVFNPAAGVALSSLNTQNCAITSGTSGYQEGEPIIVAEVNQYVDQNMDMLAADMSRGEGEFLDTLLEIMNVEKKLAFKYRLKKNFDRIYTHDGITSSEVVENIYRVYNS